MVKNSNFDSVARQLINISPKTLMNLAKHIETEKNISDLTTEQKYALELLKKVNTISAHIPGSQASKIFIHNEIQNYFSFFGLPQFFFYFQSKCST